MYILSLVDGIGLFPVWEYSCTWFLEHTFRSSVGQCHRIEVCEEFTEKRESMGSLRRFEFFITFPGSRRLPLRPVYAHSASYGALAWGVNILQTPQHMGT